MKVLCVLSCLLAVAYGGVVPWTQSGEDFAINLYKQYCAYGDKGVNGDIHWFCKSAPPGEDELYEHQTVLHGRPQTHKQVIFVQTPSKKIKHKVRVQGDAGVTQDTSIYVLPPKITHDIDVQGDITTKHEVGKPHTFYLKKNPGESHGHGHGHGHHDHDHDYGHNSYPPSPSYPLKPYAPEEPDYSYRRHRKRSHRSRSAHREPQVELQEPTFEDFAFQQEQIGESA